MVLDFEYEIIKTLGTQKKRKFGDVFLIRKLDDNQLFVLKKCSKTVQNKLIIESYLRDFSINLEHFTFQKNRCLVQNENDIYFVKSYVEGTPLDEFWKSVRKKDQFQTLKKIVKSLREPLNELKEKSIIHCDLKPSNIIIEIKDNQIIAHIIDFGLAFNLNSVEETRKILFPLGYASPELILNCQKCMNHTTDLFSIGIICWRLITGKLPLVHPNPSIMTNLQITYPLPENVAISNELYQLLSQICQKHIFRQVPNKMKVEDVECYLSNAMNQRIQSMDEICEKLDKIENRISIWKKIFQ
ncbi:MAG: protein kinase [Flavobacteriia bacterium]|nr:protein kinase [Flavobacteriia bacterium]